MIASTCPSVTSPVFRLAAAMLCGLAVHTDQTTARVTAYLAGTR
jgi:hypothetical protein